MASMGQRDIVLIGGSAGSFRIIQNIISSLPSTLKAAVFLVIHLSSREESHLTEIIQRASALRVVAATDGAPIETGTVCVAVPDYHLVVAKGHIHLSKGPREGRSRPSINVTFRSAARAYGPRVIGVLLSGMLDDGASGLYDIARDGGATIVQDPADALFPDMPVSAIRDGLVHYKVCSVEIPGVIEKLVAGMEIPMVQPVEPENGDQPLANFFTCPECHGPLHKVNDEPAEFECRVGHRFPLRTLVEEQTANQERRLYEAIVALQEGADLLRYSADKLHLKKKKEMLKEADQLRKQADTIRRLLEEHVTTPLE